MDNKKRIVVLGGGESGAGAAVLAKVKGFEVWLSDMGEIKEKYKTCSTVTASIGKRNTTPKKKYSLPTR